MCQMFYDRKDSQMWLHGAIRTQSGHYWLNIKTRFQKTFKMDFKWIITRRSQSVYVLIRVERQTTCEHGSSVDQIEHLFLFKKWANRIKKAIKRAERDQIMEKEGGEQGEATRKQMSTSKPSRLGQEDGCGWRHTKSEE